MTSDLFLFVNPKTASGLLILDNGTHITGIDTTYAGRPAKQFVIPDGSPDGNGCRIIFTAEGMVTIDQRAILWLEAGDAWLQTDDYYMQPVPPPVIIIEPCPDPDPDPITDPFGIIQDVYASGDYDLSTKAGCGIFTEDCCKRLHRVNSAKWGYIKISGAQNGFNGHRLDKVQLLQKQGDTKAGVYDIIFNSEDPAATPAFNFQGEPIESLWYYPADGQIG